MNSREQYLKARVARLEQIVALLATDLEMTESVGAAFAFDLGQRWWAWSDYDLGQPENPTPRKLEFDWVLEMWQEAMTPPEEPTP